MRSIATNCNSHTFRSFFSLDSDEERQEIRRTYEKGEGNLEYVFKMVPFLTREKDEERVLQIVKELEDDKLVAVYTKSGVKKSTKRTSSNACCNVDDSKPKAKKNRK